MFVQVGLRAVYGMVYGGVNCLYSYRANFLLAEMARRATAMREDEGEEVQAEWQSVLSKDLPEVVAIIRSRRSAGGE